MKISMIANNMKTQIFQAHLGSRKVTFLFKSYEYCLNLIISKLYMIANIMHVEFFLSLLFYLSKLINMIIVVEAK